MIPSQAIRLPAKGRKAPTMNVLFERVLSRAPKKYEEAGRLGLDTHPHNFRKPPIKAPYGFAPHKVQSYSLSSASLVIELYRIPSGKDEIHSHIEVAMRRRSAWLKGIFLFAARSNLLDTPVAKLATKGFLAASVKV